MNPIDVYFSTLSDNHSLLLVLLEEQLLNHQNKPESNRIAREIQEFIPCLSFGDAQTIVYEQLAKIAFRNALVEIKRG